MPHRRFPLAARICAVFTVAMLALLASSCGDDRDVRDPNALYACSSKDDCLSGYDCVCGWCQAVGSAPVGCDGASTADVNTVDSNTADTSKADTGPFDCDLVTWAGCPTGQGCYYDPNAKEKYCQAHGTKGQKVTCSNAGPGIECGKEGSAPLLCDVIDTLCYPTCDGSSGVGCPSAWTCYPLKDWPAKNGICVPN